MLKTFTRHNFYFAYFIAAAITLLAGSASAKTHFKNSKHFALLPTTISFTGISNKDYNDVDFVPATSNSNAPITYTLNPDPNTVATVVGTTAQKIHIIGVGQVQITANQAATTTHDAATVSATLTISPAALTIKATDKSRAYGAANPAVTYTYTGFRAGENATIAGIQVTGAIDAGAIITSSAGSTYPIRITNTSQPASNNYNITSQDGLLTISKATLRVTSNFNKVYGAALPAIIPVQYTGISAAAGDTPASVFGSSLPVATTTAQDNSTVGSYPTNVTGTITSTSNYNITYVPGLAKVTKATLRVTVANTSRPYGSANPAFTYTYSAFVNGDTPGTVIQTDAATPTSIADATTPPGNTSTITTSGLVLTTFGSNNYNIVYAPGRLTITKSIITVTAQSGLSREYGAADPAINVTYTGYVNGDDQTAFTQQATATTNTTATSAVGTNYKTIASGAAAANYSFVYVAGTFSITKKMLHVHVPNVTKVYGATTLPALTFTYDANDFANGETDAVVTRKPTVSVSGSTLASLTVGGGSGTNGAYSLTLAGAAATNYDFDYSNPIGLLTITPKVLTITATNQTRKYGANNATPTFNYTGFVNGETANNLSQKATGKYINIQNPGTAVGASSTITTSTQTYSVTVDVAAAGTVLNNYTPTYVDGTLTILPATLTIKPAPVAINKVYGAPVPTTNISYQGFVNGETQNGLTTQATLSATSLTATSPVGVYQLTAEGAAGPTLSNYTVNYPSVTFTVIGAPITVTATNNTKVYGDADPALAYQLVAGTLVTGDQLTGTLTRIAGEDVNDYAINQGALKVLDGSNNDQTANYNITYNSATFKITARPIAVTADAQTKVYGATDPALTYTYTGTLVGTDAFTGALTRLTGEDVNDYAISQGTLTLGANYSITYTGANLTITAKPISVTADAQTKVYGDTDPALTYTYTGTLVGTDAFTGALTRATGETVGSYAISQGTLALSSNYTLTYTGANLSITAKPIAVAADAQTKVYGDTDPALTYTYTGTLVGTDAFTGALTRATGENIGLYAINQGTLALSSNYTLTYTGANLSITAKPIAVAAAAKTKVYGTTDPALTYTYTGTLVGTDAFTGALTRATGETVGSYAINQGTLALSSNYTLTYTGANLSITAKPIAVTADAKTKVYGTTDPTLTYTYTGTLVGTDAFTGALTRATGETVGSYAINQGTLALSSNYTLTYTGANLSITAKPIAVTADAQTKVYGDTDPALTYTYTGTLVGTDAFTGALTRATGETVGSYAINQGTLALSSNYILTYTGANLSITAKPIAVAAASKTKVYGTTDPTLTYTYTGTLVGTDAFTGALTRATGETVGSYAINQGTLALSSNYTLTYTGANLSITAKPIAVAAASKTKVYGTTDPALTYTYTGTLVGTDAFTGALTRATGETVGSYAINQGTLALSSNYTLTYTGANLSITAKPISVTADAQTKVYGDTDPALTYTYTGTLVGTDAFTGALTRATGETVGAYAINQGTLALSSNYTLTYTGANLSITAKPIAVAAASKTKVYGTTDPALTYTYTGTLVGTDAFTGALTRATGETVGSYAINQGTLALSSNYTLTYTGANLSITAKPISVTADAQTKVYGDTDPALTYTYTGTLVGTDAFTGALTRATGETVGAYAINQGTLALSSNYTLTYTGANLSITAKPIAVTADAKTKIYGTTDPALTYTYAGTLVGTDAFTGVLTRAAGENVAAYVINQGTLTLGSNYIITYTGATFTITKGNLTITADNKSKTYGDANPALTFAYSGFIAGDNAANSITTAPVAVTTANASSGAGVYPITVSGGASDKYTFTYATGSTLTVDKATLTVTADNQTKIYGNANPPLTASYSGFVNNDDVSSISILAALSTTATTLSTPGSYPITASGAAAANYIFSYNAGILSITLATRDIVFNALPGKTYGDADFDPAATATSGETVTYSSSNTAVATIVNGKVHIVAAGFATITATVPANSNYSNIPVVSQLVFVNKATQTISFAAIPVQSRGGTYDLSNIKSSSGLPVTIVSADPMIASVTGTTLNNLRIGITTITVSQAGNANYLPAQSASQQVNVQDPSGNEVLVHQAMSPNGDGVNDVLYIEGINEHPDNRVTIINRNGVKVYETTGYNNASKAFDGHSNFTKAIQTPGTYFYLVEYTVNGQGRHKTGYFVLKF